MADKLVCWQCGGRLKGVPRPIRRFAECPECHADLHVCVMCRHYDTRLIGECNQDHADRVVDKHHANFCTYFKPRPDAYDPRAGAEAQAARERLQALFGIHRPDAAAGPEAAGEEAPKETRKEPAAAAKSEAERAREELEALFDLGGKKGGG